jgi:hypothetical protein
MLSANVKTAPSPPIGFYKPQGVLSGAYALRALTAGEIFPRELTAGEIFPY